MLGSCVNHVGSESRLLVSCSSRFDPEWNSSRVNVKRGSQEQKRRPAEETGWKIQSKEEIRDRKWRFYEEDDEDGYELEEDEEDEEDLDIRLILGLFCVGLPAAVVAIPWLVAHPMALTLFLAVAPFLQRVSGFAVKVLNSSMKAPARRFTRKNRSRARSPSRTSLYKWRKPVEPETEDEASDSEERSSWEINEKENQVRTEIEGWSELDEDRKLKLQRAKRSMRARLRRLQRKELPLFWQFILAVFPFLISWGGFL